MGDGDIPAAAGDRLAGEPLLADTFIVLDIGGLVAEQVMAVRRRSGYAFLGALPVEITVAGSSGLGSISPGQDAATIFGILDSLVVDTPPIVAQFEQPTRFGDTDIVALTVRDSAPFERLQDRLRASGLKFESSPFDFTPHCTLSQQPILSPTLAEELMAVKIDGLFECSILSLYSAHTFPRLELRYRGYLAGRPPSHPQ